MIFVDSQYNTPDEYVYLSKYTPYRLPSRERNPNFTPFSGKILDIKNGQEHAIQWFYNIIDPLLDKGFIITIVPSSDPSNTSSGMYELVEKLAANGRINGCRLLVRTKAIKKLATGGDRSKQAHYDSIRVNDKNGILKGAEVLLMDDVRTTGNSIDVCHELLLNAGAKSVQRFVLAQTE